MHLLNMTTIDKSRAYEDHGDFYLSEIYGMKAIFSLYYNANQRELPEVRAKNFLLYMLLSVDVNVSGVVIEATDVLEPILDEMKNGFKRQLDIFIPVVSEGKIIAVRKVYSKCEV